MGAPALTPRARAITAFARHLKGGGIPDFSFPAMAKAVRLTEEQLGELFPSADVLAAAAMSRLFAEADQQFFSGNDGRGWVGLGNYAALMRDLEPKRGAVSMFVRLRVEAADPEHPAHEILDELRNRNIEALESIFRGGVEDGVMRPELDPRRMALATLGLIEGSQGLKQVIDEGVDVAGTFEEFVELLKLKYEV
ncbi:hypothetical protein [Galactobacter valiniphilus]|uniref:hypothetical protein n=1 Tax=Galactobacter valiniphilus TaxID=2676122 RepID=UPI0037366D9A